MARPHKQTVDYFPHYSDASTGKTLFILETEFGNDGYAFWFKLLELLASSEGHVYDVRNPSAWKFLLAKTHVAEDKAEAIINTLLDLDAIDRDLWEQCRTLWVQKLVDNVTDAYRNRLTAVPARPSINGSKPTATKVSDVNNEPDTGIPDVGKPQMKRNEIKLNKKTTPEQEKIVFDEYVDELRSQYSDVNFDNELTKFHLYWSEGNRKLKRPKLALKNWMDKAREIKQEKSDGKGGRHPRQLTPRDRYTPSSNEGD
tara:strand:- start:595 stop:1365 length:771 start_codon:yes stop_codon:yes gene_type:complete